LDFFDQQELARRTSRWLLIWYLLAALFVVACFNAAAAAGYAVLAIYGALPLAGGEPLVWRGLVRTYFHALFHVPAGFHLAVSGFVAAIIAAVSGWRIWQLSEAGPAVADMLGAHFLERGRATPPETRVLNVVEEMAIASGIAVPPVYLLANDDAINALVAGHSPNEAVIVVTRGMAHKLTRDELQGVMGHEFSHILNGDMALNLRLVGLLAGLTCFGEFGERLVYGAARGVRGKSREEIHEILAQGRPILERLHQAFALLQAAIWLVYTPEQRAWIEAHRPRLCGPAGPPPLTDEQKQQIGALQEAFMAAVRDDIQYIRQVVQEAHQAAQSGATREEIEQILHQADEARARLRAAERKLEEDIAAVLTPEQRAARCHPRPPGG